MPTIVSAITKGVKEKIERTKLPHLLSDGNSLVLCRYRRNDTLILLGRPTSGHAIHPSFATPCYGTGVSYDWFGQ